MTNQPRLTMLSDMASDHFPLALDHHSAWGIWDLDLRGAIFDHSVSDLPEHLAVKARKLIDERGMSVYCMSTSLLVGDIRQGPEATRARSDQLLQRVLPVADVLRPQYVRLLAGQWPGRPEAPGAVDGMRKHHPWIFDEYRRCANAISAAGWTPILENEATDCFLSHPSEIVDFIREVNHPELRLTWDVQNQWATGVYPKIEHLDELAPYISYYHVKGARADDDADVAKWNVALEDSSWPVVEITRQVVARGLSDVICINPSQHGANLAHYDYERMPERDLAFLRDQVIGGR